MSKKALKYRIITILCLFVLSLVGFSFSWFNYTRVGNENRVITGQLYLFKAMMLSNFAGTLVVSLVAEAAAYMIPEGGKQ